MAKKRKSQGQGGKSTKEAKKRSRAKSKKHALRSATYAVKKLIDSALAEGQPQNAVDPEAQQRRKKKSIRRAAAATARLVEAAVAEDVEGRRRRSHETNQMEDESDSDESDEAQDAAAAFLPLTQSSPTLSSLMHRARVLGSRGCAGSHLEAHLSAPRGGQGAARRAAVALPHQLRQAAGGAQPPPGARRRGRVRLRLTWRLPTRWRLRLRQPRMARRHRPERSLRSWLAGS